MFTLSNKTIKSRTLILAAAAFIVIFSNGAFFKHALQAYPVSWGNVVMIALTALILMAFQVIFFTLFSARHLLKPVLIFVFLSSSFVAYFMSAYDIVVDTQMLQNIMQTNLNESADLLSLQQVVYVLMLGVLPSIAVYKVRIEKQSLKTAMLDKVKTIAIAAGIIVLILFTFSKFYTSFFREHKELRFYVNPTYYLYSAGLYVNQTFSQEITGIEPSGLDAHIDKNNGARKLVILVVGEAVRADHLSLNGYERETTPLLNKEHLVSFQHFASCGTATAVSVPCMFSSSGREAYDHVRSLHTENILDVLKHAGVNILWRDNNSDSKGVAVRVPFEDYKTAEKNTVCKDECRDEGMLVGLQEHIDKQTKGDIVIVLHQMGNHGPAYYKRYPAAFEKFTPVCRTNQLEECSQEEIRNAYDNAILYTDYFLANVIKLLKKNDAKFTSAMLYMSDHGESLGENGLYLHGFPYAMAPDAQKHIPAIMWFGKKDLTHTNLLKNHEQHSYTHDYLFHTLLGFFEVKTSVYRSELDILNVNHIDLPAGS
jgi:lipid A ethanolaminephosphotransferase